MQSGSNKNENANLMYPKKDTSKAHCLVSSPERNEHRMKNGIPAIFLMTLFSCACFAACQKPLVDSAETSTISPSASSSSITTQSPDVNPPATTTESDTTESPTLDTRPFPLPAKQQALLDSSAQKLIQDAKTLDLNAALLDWLFSKGMYPNTPTIEQVDQKIGIECLRTTQPLAGFETASLYSVHPVKQGGLLYLYYKKGEPKTPDGEPEQALLYHWLYVQKSLAYADFESIKEGSPIADVKAIDPVVAIYEDRDHSYEDNAHTDFRSQHYLRDGLLSVTYTYKNGGYMVKSITRRELFQLFEEGNSVVHALCAQVLAQDCLQ